ncbi:dTDP-4-dehydrorhamnose reductase [Allopseudospirillum japonicum]|uniref:dTDP-4-dehydrorhamnose reductase n=1 Tax=Allopseudospirillum japonicum TaxID=64971 RepID=A0A1H6U7S3_9GAMM|nr:sugar nucleotide-binding protein [Allopseudospirillum japonicum]SEI85657.1 dTDP-4-dehydrorhamnose reductase [Allopseudospirillum japonicum]
MNILLVCDSPQLQAHLLQVCQSYYGVHVWQDFPVSTPPDYVVHLPLVAQRTLYTSVADMAPYQQASKQVDSLLQQARAWGAGYLFLSSQQVYVAGHRISLQEEDHADAACELGTWWIEQENKISCYPKHFIMRTGYLLDQTSLESLLEKMRQQTWPQDEETFCLTTLEDLSRAILGILLQNFHHPKGLWGLYHYTGHEQSSELEVAKSIRRLAAEHEPLPDPPEETHARSVPRLLNCRRVLDTFAIHQRSWKQDLPKLVNQIYSHSLP